MKEIIQQKIWDYLDGLLPESEAAMIEKLIVENEEYKNAYEEISVLKKSLSAFQLSSISDNVLKKIVETYRVQIIKDTKTSSVKINNQLINGILFFLTTMPVIVLFMCLLKNRMNFRINISSSLIDVIMGNPVIWLLILLNLIVGLRFIQKGMHLKNKFN